MKRRPKHESDPPSVARRVSSVAILMLMLNNSKYHIAYPTTHLLCSFRLL